VLGNFVAGLVIIFIKPFWVGQYISFLGVEGQVETIELFSTTLTHADLSKVVIPNRRIVGEILHNYGTIRQLDLTVSVAYESDLAKTLAVLRQVVTQYPKVLKNPTPVIGISELADSWIDISVKPWVNVSDFAVAGPELYRVILERLVQEQIVVPYHQAEVRLLGGGLPPASR
jgi:small conductance mechanosensitive channel